MFGMEEQNEPPKFEFDLEKDLKKSKKETEKLVKKIESKLKETEQQMKKNESEELTAIAYGYKAALKVINNIH